MLITIFLIDYVNEITVQFRVKKPNNSKCMSNNSNCYVSQKPKNTLISDRFLSIQYGDDHFPILYRNLE